MKRNMIIFYIFLFLFIFSVIAPAVAGVVEKNTWSRKEPLHQGRGALGVAVANDKIYAIGGASKNIEYPSNSSSPFATIGINEEYNPSTNTWVFKSSMPKPMRGFAIASYNDKIYCFGSGLTQVYDPATDLWENKTSMPTNKTGVQANVLGDKIYLAGGGVSTDTNPPYTVYNPPYTATAVTDVYDPQTDTWSTRASLLNATMHYASAVFGGKLYIFGGLAENMSRILLQNMTQIYDPATDMWSSGKSSPYKTVYSVAGATLGLNAPAKIYLFYASYQGPPSAQVYDPASDSWTVGIAQPTFRTDFGLAVIDDLIYAIGGITSAEDIYLGGPETVTSFALNEVFTPFGYGTVHATPSLPPPLTSVPGSSPPTATLEPIPTPGGELPSAVPIIAVSASAIVAVSAGLIVYFKRFRH